MRPRLALWSASSSIALLFAMAACSGDDASSPTSTTDPVGPTTPDAQVDDHDAASRAEDAQATSDGSVTDAATDAHDAAKPGTLFFESDFESGDLKKWGTVEYCKDHPEITRVQVYSTANAPPGAPPPRLGTHALHFHVLDTDVKPCTSTENPRAQLQSPDLFVPGDERWEAWSVWVPNSFPGIPNVPGNYVLMQEDYGAPYGEPPKVGWDILHVNGTDTFATGSAAVTVSHTPLVKGKWVDYLVHKRFANTPAGGGFVEAWIDKVPVTFTTCNCKKLTAQTMISNAPTARFFLNAYRRAGMFPVLDLYFDEARVGSTREIVELP